MNSRPPPPELLPWVLAVLGDSGSPVLAPVAGDASARRYFRLDLAGESFIAVDAPPETEKNAEFLAVREMLSSAGIRVPDLIEADLSRGFMLLGDLGDRLLLEELTPESVDDCYRRAFDVLLRMGAVDPGDPGWPLYDDALLSEELGRFPQWFLDELLEIEIPVDKVWQPLASLLKASALEQPRVLVHRDFHSRNLMPQGDGALGVIDFQDAVLGPVTYDLVSLLRDCYIRWQPQQVDAWASDYLALLQGAGRLQGVPVETFLRWFDLMGLQRHLKVLGTFARLYLRDGKPGYLADLPLVLRYVWEMLERYRGTSPEIGEFAGWFDAVLVPAVAAQPWSASA